MLQFSDVFCFDDIRTISINMKVQVSLDIMYIYQNTDKIRFQLDCICIVADKVVQWWTYVTCTLMPQEMLRMCNKGLFAGVGLSGLKLCTLFL